jgi:hypothetical protein
MQLESWLDELAARVAEGAPVGTRHRIETTLGRGADARRIAAEALVDRRGQRRERFWCDGVRLQRHELLRLTCPETACPQAQALRAQWQDFLCRRAGRAPPAARAVAAPTAQPLMQEQPLDVAGHACTARPALFRCYTPCPQGAHPPLWLDQPGWDLFEGGVCIGGGLVEVGHLAGDPARPLLRPRFPSLDAAREWLEARSREAGQALTAMAGRR